MSFTFLIDNEGNFIPRIIKFQVYLIEQDLVSRWALLLLFSCVLRIVAPQLHSQPPQLQHPSHFTVIIAGCLEYNELKFIRNDQVLFRGVISSGPSAYLAGQGRFGLNGNGLAECPRCRGWYRACPKMKVVSGRFV